MIYAVIAALLLLAFCVFRLNRCCKNLKEELNGAVFGVVERCDELDTDVREMKDSISELYEVIKEYDIPGKMKAEEMFINGMNDIMNYDCNTAMRKNDAHE